MFPAHLASRPRVVFTRFITVISLALAACGSASEGNILATSTKVTIRLDQSNLSPRVLDLLEESNYTGHLAITLETRWPS